ncbi:MAG: translocation/assembly module TamB domain-containing protein [Parvibaculaceae bacterium]
MRLRRVIRFALFAFTGLVLLLAAVFGVLQTGPGKRFIASTAGPLASGNGLHVQISDIAGFVPARMDIGRVTLADDKGPFAIIEGLGIAWSPLALVSGTVSAQAVDARKISLLRLPELPPQPEGASASSPALPRLDIARLALSDIEIAEPVIGQAMRLSFAGSARLTDPAEGLFLDFALDRRDLEGRIAGKVIFVPDNGTLDIDVAADEPEGGLIAELARIAGRPPVHFAVKGKGTLDDFAASLAFTAGADIKARGTAGIQRAGEGRAAKLDLTGEIAGLLPPAAAPVFEGTTAINAALTIDAAQRVEITNARLQAAGIGATLKGTVDLETRQAQLRYTLIGGAADRFAQLAPQAQWQDWFVDGKLAGQIDRPEVKAAVTVTMPKAQGYGAQMMSANVEMTPVADGAFALAADGNAKGLTAADPKVAAALGDTLDFALTGQVDTAGKPALTAATIKLAPLAAEFTGQAAAEAVKGKLRLGRLDLAAFAPLVGRPLGGQVSADADIDMTQAMIRIAGRGSSIGVVTGIAALDGLLKGPAELAGSVERGADGVIIVEDTSLKAKDAVLTIAGRIDRSAADLTARLSLSDLALIDARVSGAAKGTAKFSGTLDELALTSTLEVPAGRAMGKPVENLAVTVKAADLTGQAAGDLTIAGEVAEKPVKGLVRFASLAESGYRFETIDLTVGANRVQGGLALAGSGLMNGSLEIAADDLADLSALALMPMAGKLAADVTLTPQQGRQDVVIKAKAGSLRVAGQAIGKADVDGTLRDVFGVPLFDGDLDIADMTAGGVKVERAKLAASGNGQESTLALDALVAGVAIAAKGKASMTEATTALDLRSLNLARGGTRATLAGPAQIKVAEGAVTIDNFVLATAKGRAALSGKAGGESLALDVKLTNLPLALARLGGYDDDLGGTLDGTIRISGNPQTPNGRYDVEITNLSNPDIVRSGAGSFDITVDGDVKNGRAGLAMVIKNPRLQDMRVTGAIMLAQSTLDLAAKGAVDLALANAFLAASGNRLAGKAAIDATVTGTFSAPAVRGKVRLSEGRFDDLVNGVTITKINGDIVGDGRALVLQNVRGQTVNGGTVTLAGRVTVDPAAGIPADIDVSFNNAALVTSETARLIADGQVQTRGPIMTRPKVTGRVAIRRLDINLPDKFGGAAKPLDVRHVGAPAGKKLAGGKSAEKKPAKERPAGTGFLADLDVTLSAPNGIFVRGMGLEAELGGDLAVRGTSAAPRSQGGFTTKRGRFDGFGRRLDLTKGVISFNGSLDPELDFVAQSESEGIIAKILITGPASEPKISFGSTPQLPQDEVIARLLFDKGAGELTLGQAAQLAQTVAQLSGSGPGMLDKMRRSLGVDSLDVGTENGGEVGMGKRLNDRIYLGVKQGAQPNSSKVTIDVDITKNIRAQGATGADGSTEVGIGAEWDY